MKTKEKTKEAAMKIAVIGAGAMGAMTGGKLTKAGNDVTLVDVWKEHIDKMNNNGLLLRHGGDDGEVIKVKAVSSAEEVGGTVDLVIVFVKGLFTAKAIEGAKCIIGPQTYVLTMQNGIGNADVLAQHVDPSRVVMGTTMGAAALLQPGEVNDTTKVAEGQYTVHITSYTKNNNERVREIAKVLTDAGISTEVSENAELLIWEKLVVNCGVNAPCLITRLNCEAFLNDENGDAIEDSIIREIVAVGQVKGIPLNFCKLKKFMTDSVSKTTHHPSMSQDAYKKVKTEVETITGAVVREGKKYGVQTPVNETLYHLVKCVENNYEKLWY
jgi:2-dehydropantoate 2-reductase